MKTTQQQILCLTMLMLMLLMASNYHVSAVTSTTADTPPIAIPRDSSMDAISASLSKGLRGLFVKRPSADHHHHHGLSSMIPAAAATPGMDNKQQLMISRGSSSISTDDIPTNSSNTVVGFGVRDVNPDHQKDGNGHGGDDHHSSSDQHHNHDHDQKHSKDDKKKKPQESSSSGNNKGRKFKVCMTHNHCYKKKLVCPKKCGKNKSSSSPTSSSGLLVPNHFPGHHNNHCILNCNKCVAHC